MADAVLRLKAKFEAAVKSRWVPYLRFSAGMAVGSVFASYEGELLGASVVIMMAPIQRSVPV